MCGAPVLGVNNTLFAGWKNWATEMGFSLGDTSGVRDTLHREPGTSPRRCPSVQSLKKIKTKVGGGFQGTETRHASECHTGALSTASCSVLHPQSWGRGRPRAGSWDKP